jgi:translation initiation factor 1A
LQWFIKLPEKTDAGNFLNCIINVAAINMLLSMKKLLFSVLCKRGIRLGKKKVLSEGAISEMVYPGQGEVLGVVTKLLGFDRIMVKCQDGAERLCRIRGKMKRRVWIREGDIVIVSPWEFQTDKRGDVVWRYTHAQADTLRRKGILTL